MLVLQTWGQSQPAPLIPFERDLMAFHVVCPNISAPPQLWRQTDQRLFLPETSHLNYTYNIVSLGPVLSSGDLQVQKLWSETRMAMDMNGRR